MFSFLRRKQNITGVALETERTLGGYILGICDAINARMKSDDLFQEKQSLAWKAQSSLNQRVSDELKRLEQENKELRKIVNEMRADDK